MGGAASASLATIDHRHDSSLRGQSDVSENDSHEQYADDVEMSVTATESSSSLPETPTVSAPGSTGPSRWPVLWGALASGGFYGLIHAGYLSGELIQRYFASHPVEYVATTLFFIGLAALASKLLDTSSQTSSLSQIALPPRGETKQTATQCDALLTHLDTLPKRQQRGYLAGRLRNAVTFVHRKQDATGLDEEVRHLSDLDAEKSHDSFALVRIIIWAVPILGFLGTVIGITLAIANLSPQQLEESLPMVTSGLGVAFDTTALSLGLSIVLMFSMFLASRCETTLLIQVDARAAGELIGRFEQSMLADSDPLTAVRRMADEVIHSSERLVARQAELWQETIQQADQRWSEIGVTAGKHLHEALSHALNDHAAAVSDGAKEVNAENHRGLDRVQQAMAENTTVIADQQDKLIKQGESLLRIVDTGSQLSIMQESLNQNLATLASSGSFAETAMSLSAAINLLAARLGQAPMTLTDGNNSAPQTTGHAA